jgi:hypothetical protein
MNTTIMTMKIFHATALLRITLILGLILPWALSLSVPTSAPKTTKTYNYFAIGSNMLPATMLKLRGIRPLNASAAILPDYELAFNIAGNPRVEPSAASIRPAVGDCLHGVLYELSESDFARVGSTEGVPFVYRWEPCQVIPYVGDEESAGQQAMSAQEEGDGEGDEEESERPACVLAYALTSTRPNTPKFIPTSPSYLRILQQGAAYWKMDRAYQTKLSEVTMATNLMPKDGLSGSLLEAAELGYSVRQGLSECLLQLAILVEPPSLD